MSQERIDIRDFAISQYHHSLSAADSLYQRYSLVVTAITAVGAASVALLFRLTANGISWMDFMGGSILVIVLGALVMATVWLSLAMFKGHSLEIPDVLELHNWAADYREELNQDYDYTADSLGSIVDDQLSCAIFDRVMDAEAETRATTDTRLLRLRRSLKSLLVAVFALFVLVPIAATDMVVYSQQENSNGQEETRAEAPTKANETRPAK